MQIQIFKVFCDLSDTGSFSRTAKANGVTQSAVSQQIRAIERRYHVRLIDRGKRHFTLTPEGRAFLETSRQILDAISGLGDRMRQTRVGLGGSLHISAVHSIGLHELPPFLKLFQRQFPAVEAHVDYRRSDLIYSAVADGDADIGLVAFPKPHKGVVIHPFAQDRLVLICAPEHPLAVRRRLRLGDLDGEKFIAFDPDQPTRKAIDRALHGAGAHIRAIQEFDNIETLKRAVQIEGAISIVPETTVRAEVQAGELVRVDLLGADMVRPLGALLPTHHPANPAAGCFLRLLDKADFSPTALPHPKRPAKGKR